MHYSTGACDGTALSSLSRNTRQENRSKKLSKAPGLEGEKNACTETSTDDHTYENNAHRNAYEAAVGFALRFTSPR
jgi:hypothetical protein